MPWEAAARHAIQAAVSDFEFDEIRRALYLMSGEDHRFNRVEEEFRDWESVQARLEEIGENEWLNNVPFDEGEPVFASNVDSIVESFMVDNDVEGFFDRLKNPDEGD